MTISREKDFSLLEIILIIPVCRHFRHQYSESPCPLWAQRRFRCLRYAFEVLLLWDFFLPILELLMTDDGFIGLKLAKGRSFAMMAKKRPLSEGA